MLVLFHPRLPSSHHSSRVHTKWRNPSARSTWPKDKDGCSILICFKSGTRQWHQRVTDETEEELPAWNEVDEDQAKMGRGELPSSKQVQELGSVLARFEGVFQTLSGCHIRNSKGASDSHRECTAHASVSIWNLHAY